MKCLPLFLLPTLSLSAATVSQWNFNSTAADTAFTTGNSSPSTGSGTASLLTTTASFATGVANGGSSDPALTDNSGWSIAGFPAATLGDLTAGAQFLVDTTGYESIIFTFDLRHSNSSSRYEAVQYTLNGTVWTTGVFFTGDAGDTWFNGRSVDLSGIAQAGNNPNFGVRVVSAFEKTTTGIGAVSYAATAAASAYAVTGNWRFDMVTVSGTAVPEPTAALLGSIGLLGLLRRRR